MRRRTLLQALALAACGGPGTATDPRAPRRIVGLGGPITETLFAAGAGARVVGADMSSVFPEAAAALPKVGYFRQFSAEGVLGLQPDLVLASDESGPAAALEHLRGAGLVLVLVPAAKDLAQGRANILQIAAAAAAPDGAAVAAKFDADVAAAEALRARTTSRPRVLFVYARGPGRLLVGGKDTAGDELLRLAGAENAGAALTGMHPWSAEAVVQAAPDFVVLPSRGLDSLGGQAGLLAQPGLAETPAGRAGRVVALDDLKLLGFGPRVGEALAELVAALHPELAGAGA